MALVRAGCSHDDPLSHASQNRVHPCADSARPHQLHASNDLTTKGPTSNELQPRTSDVIVSRTRTAPSFFHSSRARALASVVPVATTTTANAEPQVGGREVVFEAVGVLAVIIRNSIGCLLCACVATLCYSRGNIFSSQSSRLQSTESLVVASLVWSNVLYAAIILVTQVAVLAPMRFVVQPDAPAGFRFCLKRLTRASLPFYAVSLALTIGMGELFVHVLPRELRWLKPEFYVGNWVNHVYTAAILCVSREIFRTETCKGQERELREQPHRSSSGGFWRSYVRTSPQVLASVLAGLYVHIASQSRFYTDAFAVLLFAGASLGLKVGVQELVKVYVVRRGVRQIRFMCMLLGLPTVFIDTQVRVMLLVGKQSRSFNALGSVAMAAVELGLRIGKMALLVRQIQRRRRAVNETDADVSSRCSSDTSSQTDAGDENPTALTKFERWRKQMLDFHTAEVMADMYAEYIAIGCSASILFFFSDHPKYLYASASGESPSSSVWTQFELVGFQVGMEIAIDAICCAVEIAMGAQFRTVRRYGSFLGFLFMTVAVVNIAISSLLFLK